MAVLQKQKLVSDYFTLEEFTRSWTAVKHGICNDPSEKVIANLNYGCSKVLDPLRQTYGKPIIITSGYRCKELNKLVGGVTNSWHQDGNAADIHISSKVEARELFAILKSNPNVDTCLFEHTAKTQWLHVQWNVFKTPRRHFNFNYKA